MSFGSVITNLPSLILAKRAFLKHEVIQTNADSLVLYTSKFTGHSPTDKFIIDSPIIFKKINWKKILKYLINQ
ncbi:MAG: hypothetical protein KatS3mg092_0435 [Patescibacteria group bacterium]|nr:MAG: hypothetical protein KatS3mg092_0435 [Patescibacteria group bacterium]